MLQRCVALKNRPCESFRVTSPEHFVLSLLYFGVKAQLYFVNSSCMSLDKKTLLKIWLNPELNLTIFQEKKSRHIKNKLQHTVVSAGVTRLKPQVKKIDMSYPISIKGSPNLMNTFFQQFEKISSISLIGIWMVTYKKKETIIHAFDTHQ